jgi:hypothetical protein
MHGWCRSQCAIAMEAGEQSAQQLQTVTVRMTELQKGVAAADVKLSHARKETVDVLTAWIKGR